MTAYVTFRALQSGEITLQSPVVVSANALAEPASKMDFLSAPALPSIMRLKMVLVNLQTISPLLWCESVSGTEEAFLAEMNFQAKRLGMSHTHFRNPHGLPDNAHVTTVRDMAVLSKCADEGISRVPLYLQNVCHTVWQAEAKVGKHAVGALSRRHWIKTRLYLPIPAITWLHRQNVRAKRWLPWCSVRRPGFDRAVAAAVLLDQAFARVKLPSRGRKLATLVRPSDPGSLPARWILQASKKTKCGRSIASIRSYSKRQNRICAVRASAPRRSSKCACSKNRER